MAISVAIDLICLFHLWICTFLSSSHTLEISLSSSRNNFTCCEKLILLFCHLFPLKYRCLWYSLWHYQVYSSITEVWTTITISFFFPYLTLENKDKVFVSQNSAYANYVVTQTYAKSATCQYYYLQPKREELLRTTTYMYLQVCGKKTKL